VASVTLQVDNGTAVEAQLAVVPRQRQPAVLFSGSVKVDSGATSVPLLRPTEGAHVITTTPRTVAPPTELAEVTEQHTCDMVFLPDVNGDNAGYLFVAERNTCNLSIFHWFVFESFTSAFLRHASLHL
jgi:hypothetical protein